MPLRRRTFSISSTRAQVLLSSSSDSGLLLPAIHQDGQSNLAARYVEIHVRTRAALVEEDDPIDVWVETSRAESAKQRTSVRQCWMTHPPAQ